MKNIVVNKSYVVVLDIKYRFNFIFYFYLNYVYFLKLVLGLKMN